MAVQAQFGCFAAGSLPCGGGFSDEQLRAALLSAAVANNNAYHCPGVVSGAQSELTCSGSGGVLSSRKRGRGVDYLEQYVSSSPSGALLPITAMQNASRGADSAAPSTSGQTTVAPDALMVAELCRHGAEVDALVRAQCERLRAGLEQASKRQCRELARAVAGAAARRLREKEAELDAARRRATELEEQLRQAAVESQAWLGVARSNEAVAAGLRATLDHLLLRGVAAGGCDAAATAVEGCGESDPTAVDDAQSCCFVYTDAAAEDDAAASPSAKWACKACGEREATVLLLPCRHLSLCKACEPRADACPVCLAAKNASIHVAGN